MINSEMCYGSFLEEKSIKFDFVDGVMVNDIKFSRNKCGFIFNDTFYIIFYSI